MLRRTILTGLLALSPAFALAQEGTVPAGYPADYQAIIDASKTESSLLIYSNVSAANFAPFVALAKQRYPWITIETTDDGSVWEKFFAETGSGVRSADILLDTAPERWVDTATRGVLEPYVSPETPNLPEWSLQVAPGIYAASADPFIFAYNRRAFDGAEPPNSVPGIAAFVAENPDLRGNIAAYDAERPLGLAVWKTWFEDRDDGEALLTALGAKLRPEASAGTMREKVTTGEYAVAIFTSGAGIRAYEEPAVKALAGWLFPSDGTPVVQRSIAISKSAASPNSAKLILDLLLSRDGQIAFAEGGQTPYRADIGPGDVPFASLTGIAQEIGEDNIIMITPTNSLLEGRDEFLAVWKKALGR